MHCMSEMTKPHLHIKNKKKQKKTWCASAHHWGPMFINSLKVTQIATLKSKMKPANSLSVVNLIVHKELCKHNIPWDTSLCYLEFDTIFAGYCFKNCHQPKEIRHDHTCNPSLYAQELSATCSQ